MSVTLQLSERSRSISEDSGYQMQMDEVLFKGLNLKWASYVTPERKVMTFQPKQSAIVSHFLLADPGTSANKSRPLMEKQFVVYREAGTFDLAIEPTGQKNRCFFELVMTDDFFDNLYTEEIQFFPRFREHRSDEMPFFDFKATMAPAMQGIIDQMRHTQYTGHLKGLYLEAKAIELFLLQVAQLDAKSAIRPIALQPGDIERLYAIRDFISANLDEHYTITSLARKAGINQMKLKSGFRQLFNTTVFGHLTDVRMEEARRLLLDERMPVGEVADRVGYKHPHHFTVAFKKRFGVTPRGVKGGAGI